MTRFPAAAHLVSWAGLAPVTRQSGLRSRKPGKGKGDSYLKGYCTQCAVGRSILVIVWHLLTSPEARFRDLGPEWHARSGDRDRKLRAHVRQLQPLGLDVTLAPAKTRKPR
jgi:transposase